MLYFLLYTHQKILFFDSTCKRNPYLIIRLSFLPLLSPLRPSSVFSFIWIYVNHYLSFCHSFSRQISGHLLLSLKQKLLRLFVLFGASELVVASALAPLSHLGPMVTKRVVVSLHEGEKVTPRQKSSSSSSPASKRRREHLEIRRRRWLAPTGGARGRQAGSLARNAGCYDMLMVLVRAGSRRMRARARQTTTS